MPVYDCTSLTKVFIMFTESGEGRRQRREARETGRGEREVRDGTHTCTYLYRESYIHTLRHTDDDVIG